jgi:uncharacterized protein (TIGR03086 family)
MPGSEVPLPTFLIIGAQKSGTRWLRINVGHHPDVYTAPTETQFFHSPVRFESLGLDWYRAQFPGWNGQQIVGEATPGYMIWRHHPRRVAQRIVDVLPDVRLIAILRDPVDRAYSAMVHFARQGKLPPGSTLLELVGQTPPEQDPLCLVAGGWYALSLKPYQQLFGDRLLVLLHDEIKENALGAYERTLRHIGAAPDFVPPSLETVLYSNQTHREDPPEAAADEPELSREDRQRLFAYFREDVRALEKMLERDLSTWDPGGSYTMDLDLWKERGRRGHPRANNDVVHCYTQTADWIEGLIRATTPEQYELPTPCAEWNVRDLLGRLVSFPRECAAALQGAKPATADAQDSPVDDDAAAAFRSAADDLLTAMNQPGRLSGTVALPFREMFAATWARFVFVDQLTHGWDLATATRQDATIPPHLLDAADQAMRAEFRTIARRPETFDVEVSVTDSATPTERFVAYLGRDPAFGRS